MLVLGATELSRLRQFVKDVIEVCELDDTGVTGDLYEPALVASEILGMVTIREEDE